MNAPDNARIFHIACPTCGGTLPRPEGKTVISCPYCGRKSKLVLSDHTPRYFLKPLVQDRDLRDVLLGIFQDPDTPMDMASDSTLRSSGLYFVPFYEISGKRADLARVQREARWTDDVDRYQKTVDDTLVSIHDFYFVIPACRIRGWGLEQVKLAEARTSAVDAEYDSYDSGQMQKMGTVVSPDRPAAEAQKEFERLGSAALSRTKEEIIEKAVNIVYYPLWRLTFRYRKRLYPAVIDGLTGEVIHSRLPENDRFRIPYFLAAVAVVALVFSGAARLGLSLPAYLMENKQFLALGQYGLFFTAIVLLGTLFVLTILLGASWDKLRYPGEIVVQKGSKYRERIGRPAKTFFDKLMEKELRFFQELLKGMANTQRRRW